MNIELTEIKVREIAKEEALRVNKELINKIDKNTKIMERLERLLLGEEGVDIEDTLKARANFAYLYAKRNTESGIIEAAKPALEWFADMKQIEPGCKESKLEVLGKVINLYVKVEWILAIFGISTIVNLVVAIKVIYDLI